MSDVVPIPLDLFDRLERAGLDVEAILHRATLPKSLGMSQLTFFVCHR